MKLRDFDYELPEDRIAQVPVEPRHAARLLVHETAADRTAHRRVIELPRVLEKGDLLVVNDSRVRSARLCGRRRTGGQAEVLLLERRSDSEGLWRALVRPAGRVKAGETIELEGGRIVARMVERRRFNGPIDGEWIVELTDPARSRPASDEWVEQCGRMPLPPYIKRSRGEDPLRERDRLDYQTLFARATGAIAAPTAGLHFTPNLLTRLAEKGVELTSVTLHVGEGTFRPVAVADPREHRMHSERFALSAGAAEKVEACRRRGGRVVAVGTTSLRVLEACADANGRLEPSQGETSLFLLPGARIKVADALFTNFHLPRSTLLMLVSAFAGRERILRLYREAIELGYRFYSYGDAMLLLR